MRQATHEPALMAETALAQERLNPEEGGAWVHLQRVNVAVIPFPFSDLSQKKLRSALLRPTQLKAIRFSAK